MCFRYGIGTLKSYDKSFNWFKKAAEQGLAEAQRNLGSLYENGKGCTKNYKEAFKWYYRSAVQGYAEGQYNIGRCYRLGYGVIINEDKAIEWYEKAADQNYPPALLFLEFSKWLIAHFNIIMLIQNNRATSLRRHDYTYYAEG